MSYDTHYQTPNLFGEPYPELVQFFANHPKRGTVLDLGCGQGRNAIALARMGYNVHGIDNSEVGIAQMNAAAKKEELDLEGEVGDIYALDDLHVYDFILLDSMFHFGKNDRQKETGLIRHIVRQVKNGCLIVVCIQDTGNKVQILNDTLDLGGPLPRVADQKFNYVFKDQSGGHNSTTPYRMIVARKEAQ